MQEKKTELTQWVEDQRDIISAAERLPQQINSFLEDFQQMDVRRQKAHLQTILKAAYVKRDEDRVTAIGLEFRTDVSRSSVRRVAGPTRISKNLERLYAID